MGGLVVVKSRADASDSADGGLVHMYKDRSTAALVTLQRRLMCVSEVPDGIVKYRLTLCRSLELGSQWEAVVRTGAVGMECGVKVFWMLTLLCFLR